MEESFEVNQTFSVKGDSNNSNDNHPQKNSKCSISPENVAINRKFKSVYKETKPKLKLKSLNRAASSCGNMINNSLANPRTNPNSTITKVHHLQKSENKYKGFDDVNRASSNQECQPLKLPVSIMSCKIVRSTIKNLWEKHRSTEYVLKTIIQGDTFTTYSHLKGDSIQWNEKILRVIDQTSRINEIILSVSSAKLQKCCSKSCREVTKCDKLGNSSDYQLVLNVLSEIKAGVLYPKTYKMENCDGKIVIDIRLKKLYPVKRQWKNYDEIILCFYFTEINIEKSKYFTKQYYVKVELKNSNGQNKWISIDKNQRTPRKSCTNNKIVYNTWVFIKIQPSQSVPILRVSLCDSKTDKIKGSRLFLPQDHHLVSERDNQSISSIDNDMNCIYTMKGNLGINKKDSSNVAHAPPTNISFDDHVIENKFIDPLFLRGSSSSTTKPQLKKFTEWLTLKNHIIGDVNFYYGGYTTC